MIKYNSDCYERFRQKHKYPEVCEIGKEGICQSCGTCPAGLSLVYEREGCEPIVRICNILRSQLGVGIERRVEPTSIF